VSRISSGVVSPKRFATKSSPIRKEASSRDIVCSSSRDPCRDPFDPEQRLDPVGQVVGYRDLDPCLWVNPQSPRLLCDTDRLVEAVLEALMVGVHHRRDLQHQDQMVAHRI
jgi:hypothetical protein